MKTEKNIGNGFKSSKYQQAIYDFITKEKGNAVVEAVAGSGKTTTIIEATKQIPQGDSAIFVAFNKSIATELSKKLPYSVKAKTLHSLGYGMFFSNSPNKVTLDNDKLGRIIIDVMKEEKNINFHERDEMIVFLKVIIPKIKATLSDVNMDALSQLANEYNIFYNITEETVEIIEKILNKCLSDTSVIDFDDMIWIPVMMKYRSKKYDWVFVDESQDLNKSQFELIKMLCNGGTRIIAVGDSRQAIYGFRGADSNSMDNFRNHFSAKELPLSITYRCPKSVTELAQQFVANIEPADDAQDGLVDSMTTATMLESAKEGELIICRTNAPLVSVALNLIKMRKKVVVLGKDIGKNIIKIIDSQKAYDKQELIRKISSFEREQEKLLDMIERGTYNKKHKARVLNNIDSAVIILTIGAQANSVQEIRNILLELFSDKKDGIVCSSVHKAKGLENKTVYILGYHELMPHPMAETAEEINQEYNMKYVAVTRAKENLHLVTYTGE